MINFHGYNKKRNFFEGWYFKHQTKENTIAFIPGINIDGKGYKYAFIQVITNKFSYNFKYDFSDFKVSKNELRIKIGNNIFSKEGIYIDIKDENLIIKGEVKYRELTPIKYDIMGPFKYVPFMECNHGVLSMYHKLKGKFIINNEKINLDNGIGYIEKDFGTSFPKEYLWTQCNLFENTTEDYKYSIMASVANIPFMGGNFRGCICIVYYKGKEYRLATYNGVRVLKYSNDSLVLKRGKYKLEIKVMSKKPQKLLAPLKGNMEKIIHENPSCRATFKFYINNELAFNLYSDNCSFEYV